LIRVTYAGVNPVDYKMLDRLTTTTPFPYVLGADFAGVVERVPAGESGFQVGDRVFGMTRSHGSYAEYTAIAAGADAMALIPDDVTDEQAAALPVAAITALGSLNFMGVTVGQRLLVTGAAGGVGGYAVQMAHARGAHVIATVRGGVEEVRSIGADAVYDATAIDVIAALHAAHPEGIDAVLDLVNSKDTVNRYTDIIKPGGKLVSAIGAADEARFAEHNITALNIGPGTNPASTPQGLSEVARMLAEGTITTRIHAVVELKGAAQILEKLRNGGLRGKAVIRI
ncbi:MAG: NADP-dependent oxidoreductase, partial [bacterium]